MGEGGGEGPRPGPAETADRPSTGGDPSAEGPRPIPRLNPDADNGTPDVVDVPVINPFARKREGKATTPMPDPAAEGVAGDETAPADAERAREVAEDVIDARVSSLKDDLRTESRKATADEKALLLTDYYRHGFPPETYDAYGKRIPVGETGIKITTSDGEEITVNALTEQTVEDGKATYKCEVVKDGKTEPTTAEVSGADLAKAYMAENADAVTNNFTDPTQKTLMEWHAKGGEGPVPLTNAELTQVSKSAEGDSGSDEVEFKSASEATRVIRNQVARLQGELDSTPEEKRTSKEYLKKQQQVANLRVAEEATGPLGSILRKNVLEQVRRDANVKQIDIQRLFREDGQFAKDVESAQQELKNYFDDMDISDKNRKTYESALKNPSELCDLMMNDADFAKIGEDLTDGLFGHLNDQQMNEMYQDLLNANQDLLDATVIGKIKNMSTAKKLGILAIILGAIPAAAIAVAGAVAVGTAGAAGTALGGRR